MVLSYLWILLQIFLQNILDVYVLTGADSVQLKTHVAPSTCNARRRVNAQAQDPHLHYLGSLETSML